MGKQARGSEARADPVPKLTSDTGHAQACMATPIQWLSSKHIWWTWLNQCAAFPE